MSPRSPRNIKISKDPLIYETPAGKHYMVFYVENRLTGKRVKRTSNLSLSSPYKAPKRKRTPSPNRRTFFNVGPFHGAYRAAVAPNGVALRSPSPRKAPKKRTPPKPKSPPKKRNSPPKKRNSPPKAAFNFAAYDPFK